MEKTEAKILRIAAKYCSTSERCVQEVKKKIASYELPEEAQERIINRLMQERFIDEKRYCAFFVGDKLRFNKWGKIKIDYELRKKSIPEAIRQEAISGIDHTEYTRLLTDILKSKLKTVKGKDPYDICQKTLRFAIGRGFESDLAIKCLKQLTQTTNYENVDLAEDLE